MEARGLQHFLFSLFGTSWVLPYLVKNLLMDWNGNFVHKKKRKAWRRPSRNEIKEPSKGCNALINLSRIPLYLIYTCGVKGIL